MRPKIALNVLQNLTKLGGMNLCNIEWKQKSMHLTWLKKLKESPEKWEYVYDWISSGMGEHTWKCNISKRDVIALPIHDCFWQNLLITWSELHYLPSDKVTNI